MRVRARGYGRRRGLVVLVAIDVVFVESLYLLDDGDYAALHFTIQVQGDVAIDDFAQRATCHKQCASQAQKKTFFHDFGLVLFVEFLDQFLRILVVNLTENIVGEIECAICPVVTERWLIDMLVVGLEETEDGTIDIC